MLRRCRKDEVNNRLFWAMKLRPSTIQTIHKGMLLSYTCTEGKSQHMSEDRHRLLSQEVEVVMHILNEISTLTQCRVVVCHICYRFAKTCWILRVNHHSICSDWQSLLTSLCSLAVICGWKDSQKRRCTTVFYFAARLCVNSSGVLLPSSVTLYMNFSVVRDPPAHI